jgi:diadenosine tetraphosphatase ApaH/serine/threonine PP2A family protein phosphatase
VEGDAAGGEGVRRTLFIGDVHGCAEELDALLEKCAWRPEDRVVLVGDLVAKGPDSAGVVRRAREGGMLAVRGNHDAHVLRWRAGQSPAGRKLKPEHEQVLDTLSPEDWRYLEEQPLYRRFPELNVVVVHGGLVPGVRLEEQEADLLLNLRSLKADGTPSKKVDAGVAWASRWPGPERVIFGHDAIRGLQRHPYAVGLDTGCVYGGRLTAYLLPEGTFCSVPAKRAYMPF